MKKNLESLQHIIPDPLLLEPSLYPRKNASMFCFLIIKEERYRIVSLACDREENEAGVPSSFPSSSDI